MDHDSIGSEAWAEACRRADILSKLPDRPGNLEVSEALAGLDASRATLFRWLKRFRQDDRTCRLAPCVSRRGF